METYTFREESAFHYDMNNDLMIVPGNKSYKIIDGQTGNFISSINLSKANADFDVLGFTGYEFLSDNYFYSLVWDKNIHRDYLLKWDITNGEFIEKIDLDEYVLEEYQKNGTYFNINCKNGNLILSDSKNVLHFELGTGKLLNSISFEEYLIDIEFHPTDQESFYIFKYTDNTGENQELLKMNFEDFSMVEKSNFSLGNVTHSTINFTKDGEYLIIDNVIEDFFDFTIQIFKTDDMTLSKKFPYINYCLGKITVSDTENKIYYQNNGDIFICKEQDRIWSSELYQINNTDICPKVIFINNKNEPIISNRRYIYLLREDNIINLVLSTDAFYDKIDVSNHGNYLGITDNNIINILSQDSLNFIKNIQTNTYSTWLKFMNNSDRVIFADSANMNLIIHDIFDGTQRTFETNHESEIVDVTLSDDDKKIITFDKFGGLSLWNFESGDLIANENFGNLINHADFLDDDELFVFVNHSEGSSITDLYKYNFVSGEKRMIDLKEKYHSYIYWYWSAESNIAFDSENKVLYYKDRKIIRSYNFVTDEFKTICGDDNDFYSIIKRNDYLYLSSKKVNIYRYNLHSGKIDTLPEYPWYSSGDYHEEFYTWPPSPVLVPGKYNKIYLYTWDGSVGIINTDKITSVENHEFEKKKNNDFIIYPNPVQNILMIESGSKDESIKIKSVEIYDLSLRKVFEKKYDAHATIKKLNLNFLAVGAYIIKIEYLESNFKKEYRKIIHKID